MIFVTEWIERDLVADEGETLLGPISKTLDECKISCDNTADCNSISWNAPRECFLKKKCLTEHEQSKPHSGFKSYYKPCMMSGMIIIIDVAKNPHDYYSPAMFIIGYS